MWNGHWATCIPPSERTTGITKLWPLTPSSVYHILQFTSNTTYFMIIRTCFIIIVWFLFLNLCTEDCRWSQQRAEPRPSPEQAADDQASIWGLSPGTETNTRLRPDDIFDLVSATWQQSRTTELSFTIAVHQRWTLINNQQSHPGNGVIHKWKEHGAKRFK